MKNLVLLIFLLPVFCNAQNPATIPAIPIDSITHEFVYTDIVSIPGVDKSALFTKANEWVAVRFNSAKNVVQMNDKEAGKLIVKGVIEKNLEYRMLGKKYLPYYLHFTLNLTFKDGKYRLVIDGFSAENKTQNASVYDTNISPALLDIVNKYNAKKRYDDGDDDGGFSLSNKKWIAQFDAQYLQHTHELATMVIDEMRKAMKKGGKDDF